MERTLPDKRENKEITFGSGPGRCLPRSLNYKDLLLMMRNKYSTITLAIVNLNKNSLPVELISWSGLLSGINQN